MCQVSSLGLEIEHLTARVLRRQIKALEKVSKEEKIDRSAALRKVLDIGLKEYSKRKAADEYRAGMISVGRGAEEAGISIAEFYRVLSLEGVPIRVDTEAVRAAFRKDFGELER
jgi:predicted HTH domain antitoxin